MDEFRFKLKIIKLFLIFLLVFQFFKFCSHNLNSNNEQEIIRTNALQIKPNVKIFNLSAPLVPASLYASIQCANAKSFQETWTTTLCIHESENSFLNIQMKDLQYMSNIK